MLPQFSTLWDWTTLIRPMRHRKSQDGSLTFQTETPEDRPPEEGEGGRCLTLQDHLQAEEVEEVEEVEAVEGEEAAEEHFHCQDTHPLN